MISLFVKLFYLFLKKPNKPFDVIHANDPIILTVALLTVAYILVHAMDPEDHKTYLQLIWEAIKRGPSLPPEEGSE